MTDEYLFISDCHLDVNRQDITDTLLYFLTNRAPKARFLYILGDLFEVWIGDDDPASELEAIFDCFQTLSKHTKIYFLAGNRDFLFGEPGARKMGAHIIDEPSFIHLGQQRVGLLHGDSLCTDDAEYQQFRKMVRGDQWRDEFLNKPLAERKHIATGLREQSKSLMHYKSMDIMDANRQAVIDSFVELEVNTIIHGHTHRPATHHYPGDKTRYVLGDWNPEPSFLSWRTDTGFVLTDPRV